MVNDVEELIWLSWLSLVHVKFCEAQNAGGSNLGTKQHQNLEFEQPFHRHWVSDFIHASKAQPFSSITSTFHNQDDVSS